MAPVTIRYIDSGDDHGIELRILSAADLSAALKSIGTQRSGSPLLIDLSNETGVSMAFGVGSPFTSIEFISNGQHYRALSSAPASAEVVHFDWNGHHTPVPSEYLISQADGERAVIGWFESGVLDEAVRWAVRPWPPRARADT